MDRTGFGGDHDVEVLGTQDELGDHGVDEHAVGLDVGVDDRHALEHVVPEPNAVLLGVALGQIEARFWLGGDDTPHRGCRQ
jgi:hypothetical protein